MYSEEAVERDERPWDEWDMPMHALDVRRPGRFPLLTRVSYERGMPVTESGLSPRSGHALSLNVSDGGMCLLMDHAPELEAVLRVRIPTTTSLAKIPTLAEVRWVRRLPFVEATMYCVGFRFLL
jgi:hypothetical protein